MTLEGLILTSLFAMSKAGSKSRFGVVRHTIPSNSDPCCILESHMRYLVAPPEASHAALRFLSQAIKAASSTILYRETVVLLGIWRAALSTNSLIMYFKPLGKQAETMSRKMLPRPVVVFSALHIIKIFKRYYFLNLFLR